jgi:hypothetical protein
MESDCNIFLVMGGRHEQILTRARMEYAIPPATEKGLVGMAFGIAIIVDRNPRPLWDAVSVQKASARTMPVAEPDRCRWRRRPLESFPAFLRPGELTQAHISRSKLQILMFAL